MEEWNVRERAGLSIVACGLLEAVPGIAHGFSTRRQSHDTPFDLGSASDGDSISRSRRRTFCAAIGLGEVAPFVVRQVHGDRVVEIDAHSSLDAVPVEADGLIAVGDRGAPPPIGVRTADCVPVLIADRVGRTVAAVHAGWRGVAAGILPRAIRRMGRLGGDVSDFVVALGPAIGPCCYEVGAEVIEAVSAGCGASRETISRSAGEGGTTVDLCRALMLQAESAGVPVRSVSTAPWCTFCCPGLFFSYRREGAAAGRQMAVIGAAPPASCLTAAPG